MVRLIIRRIASASVLIVGLLTIMFLIAHIAPGDPVQAMIAPTIPSQVAIELRHQFGLDQPLPVQYGQWIWNALHGNLGISFSHQRPVADVLAQFLANTSILAVTAIALELVLGLSIGFVAARFHNSPVKKVMMTGSLIVCTLPTFWIGLVLLAVFSYMLGIFPSSHMHSLNSENLSSFGTVYDLLLHLALPAFTIAIPGAATIARFVYPNLLKTRREEYITFARSLGISQRQIFFHYVLLNSITPVITLLGLEIGTLLAGALVTETIFAWPGMGRLAVLAISSRDYPLVMGCTLVSGVVVILGNLLADVVYTLADPRVKARS